VYDIVCVCMYMCVCVYDLPALLGGVSDQGSGRRREGNNCESLSGDCCVGSLYYDAVSCVPSSYRRIQLSSQYTHIITDTHSSTERGTEREREREGEKERKRERTLTQREREKPERPFQSQPCTGAQTHYVRHQPRQTWTVDSHTLSDCVSDSLTGTADRQDKTLVKKRTVCEILAPAKMYGARDRLSPPQSVPLTVTAVISARPLQTTCMYMRA